MKGTEGKESSPASRVLWSSDKILGLSEPQFPPGKIESLREDSFGASEALWGPTWSDGAAGL